MIPSLLLSLLFFAIGGLSSYAPVPAVCPNRSLVRAATGLADEEEKYRVARKAVADVHLRAWLTETNCEFETAELPTVRFFPICQMSPSGLLTITGCADNQWRWLSITAPWRWCHSRTGWPRQRCQYERSLPRFNLSSWTVRWFLAAVVSCGQ